MSDSTTTVTALREAMRRFVSEREWEPFHTPKNLSMGTAIEAAELMEHFLWVENHASRQIVNDSVRMGEVADEIADVACYLLALCNTLEIDLSEAVQAKLGKNAVKYPVERFRGRYRVED